MAKTGNESASGEQEPQQRRRFRLRPRLPGIRRGDLRAREEFRKLREGMQAIHHACPEDGTPMNLLDVYPTGSDGEVPKTSEPYRALVCPSCHYTVPVNTIAEQLREQAEPLKQAERQFLLFALGIIVLFGAITAMTGNLLTLLGALLFTLTLLLKALFYRYRHWQAVTGQVFLKEAPFFIWIRSELGARPEPKSQSIGEPR